MSMLRRCCPQLTRRGLSAASRSLSTSSIASKHAKVVFSGIQPTGIPHLGNYFGALSNWVEFQNATETKGQGKDQDTMLLYAVVGLHALTMPQDPKKLLQDRMDTLASLLAIGLSPEKSIIFCQEDVPYHAELAWLLSCKTMIGSLKRMTTWKSKLSISRNDKDETIVDESMLNLGLFAYPVLQAADVLLYRATHVPVGDDQRQHLELARDLAQTMNRALRKNHFPLPNHIINPAKRILALRGDPENLKKMSKSAADPKSRILISDSPDAIHAKIRGAVTDSANEVPFPPLTNPEHGDPLAYMSPGVANLVTILASCTGEPLSDVAWRYRGKSYGVLKSDVAEAVVQEFDPIRKEFLRLKRDESYLKDVVRSGREKALALAVENIRAVKEALGIGAL